MSAYIVDKRHILYLVSAAMSRRIVSGHSTFAWIRLDETKPGGYERGSLARSDYQRAVEVANMLWKENFASVNGRHKENESSETVTVTDFTSGERLCDIDPVQVLKACHCYTYQSCEHEGWHTSDAKAFIQALQDFAASALIGYDDAAWGAPDPIERKPEHPFRKERSGARAASAMSRLLAL